jgi:hypothetical protein
VAQTDLPVRELGKRCVELRQHLVKRLPIAAGRTHPRSDLLSGGKYLSALNPRNLRLRDPNPLRKRSRRQVGGGTEL